MQNKDGKITMPNKDGKEIAIADEKFKKLKLEEPKISSYKLKSKDADLVEYSKDLVKAINEYLFGPGENIHTKVRNHKINQEFVKGNCFDIENFAKSIYAIIEKIGDKAILKKPKFDKNDKYFEHEINQIKILQELLKDYHHIPGFKDLIDNMARAGMRNKASTQALTIVANSIFSQALGIMTLNFLYGKMMKKYASIKQSLIANANANVAKGGQKNENK